MSQPQYDNNGVIIPGHADIVIFGATGDLTKRKLIPALARMFACGLIAPGSRIIGVVRTDDELSSWVNDMSAALQTYAPTAFANTKLQDDFFALLMPFLADLEHPERFADLRDMIDAPDTSPNAMFYFAIPPIFYGQVAHCLHGVGLHDEIRGWRRVIIEKPFGLDLASAKDLNNELQSYFNEAQIYRIDHYMGKGSVQNLFAFRFANSVLEPLWNRNYIDHVQITVAESIGIEYRGPYYENAGVLRDMIQNHLLQLMALVAMEPPAELSADAVRYEKIKVLRSIREIDADTIDEHCICSQYGPGLLDDTPLQGYRWEEGVKHNSSIPTFAALKLYVDNWRWQDVPWLICSGKRLPKRVSEIAIRFRNAPSNLFSQHQSLPHANELVFRLQPDDAMTLHMNAREPGLGTNLHAIKMNAPYAEADDIMPEAYESLLHDALLGDATLFNRADEVEEAWRVLAPVLQHWNKRQSVTLYPGGTWEIPGLEHLAKNCAGGWRLPV
ncbi:MAG: glucose-6-phosphate dehydrogenase [Mariprofundales bacterium]